MLDVPAPISFIHQTGLDQTSGMLGNGFEIGAQTSGYSVQCDSRLVAYQRQDLDPPVIGDALEMPL